MKFSRIGQKFLQVAYGHFDCFRDDCEKNLNLCTELFKSIYNQVGLKHNQSDDKLINFKIIDPKKGKLLLNKLQMHGSKRFLLPL